MSKKIEYPKLPPKLKAKWVEALRSGKYKQGKSSLLSKDENKEDVFCCLGVLGLASKRVSKESMRDRGVLSDLTKKSACPTALLKELPLGHGDNDLEGFLATKNDDDNWSFKRIAAWVEKNL